MEEDHILFHGTKLHDPDNIWQGDIVYAFQDGGCLFDPIAPT